MDRHEVVIGADWHVQVPHDVSAERVAVALGGYLTCVELVDRALPAARELFGLVRRRRFPELRRGGDRVWVPARPAEGCCRGPSIRYSGPAEAAVHLRGIPHAAAAHGTGQRLVNAVFAAVMRAHGYDRDVPFPETEARQASACVPSVRDIRLLWLAGVAPRYVATVHRALGIPGAPCRSTSTSAWSLADLTWPGLPTALGPMTPMGRWPAQRRSWTRRSRARRAGSARDCPAR